MLEDKAALKIQSFFASYRLKKQNMAQQAVATSSASKLLQAFDLRFQCMKVVAAAKFPERQPINVPKQIESVINKIRATAIEKGIVQLDAIDAIERLFRQNIVLAERVQTPYHQTWELSYRKGINNQQLIKNAYTELCNIIRKFNLLITFHDQKSEYTPDDVLGLARDVIGHASSKIIEVLAESEELVNAVHQKEFSDSFIKMLAVYMKPGSLAESQENVQQMAGEINTVQTILRV